MSFDDGVNSERLSELLERRRALAAELEEVEAGICEERAAILLEQYGVAIGSTVLSDRSSYEVVSIRPQGKKKKPFVVGRVPGGTRCKRLRDNWTATFLS